MIVLKLILFTLFISVSLCRTPDKVYCANKECDGPISKAKTLISYNSADPDLISFRVNSEAIIYMKSAGTNKDLWFANIGGKSGFVNSNFLREIKIIEKNLHLIVPYENKKQENIVLPDKVLKPHEVFEGTTIYTTEAAVNEAQQDSSTESPVTDSREDLTPSLNTATETLNQDEQNITPNVPGQDIDEIKEASEQQSPTNEEPATVTSMSPETLVTAENMDILKEVAPNEDVATPTETVIEPPTGNSNENEHVVKQVDVELPKELPSDSLPPHQILTTGSESLVEVPEKQDFLQNTLSNSDQSDVKEQNTSTPNSIVDNVQVVEETSNETIEPNGNSIHESVENPINETIESLITEPVLSPTSESDVSPTNEPDGSPAEAVVNQALDPVKPAVNEPAVDQIQQVLPPIYNNFNVGNQGDNLPPVVDSAEVSQSTTETPLTETLPTIAPLLAPSTETLLPVFAESLPPTTETIPPIYSEENQNMPTQETFPPIMNMEAPPTTEITPPELSPLYTYSTTPAPDEMANPFITQETSPIPNTDFSSEVNVEDIIASLPETPEEITSSTDAPVQEESTEGFFSNMYSTVADIWPSSTQSPESLYNTEYSTHESEKADGYEGFSFVKYFMTTYYSIFGTSEESKALFASIGETCFSDEYCDGTSNDGSNRLLTFLLTTASSVLLFTLGYYYIDNRRQDGRLIGTINSLQRDLLFTSKECEILKEELTTTKNKLAGIEDSSFGMDDMVQSLKEEINELKGTNDRLRNSLDDNEKLLKVSENTAGELQNTLGEVENTLSELLAERANSEEQIVELNGKIQAFEEELISVSRERDNFQLKYVSAETALEEFRKQKKQLEDVNQQLAEAKNTIELQKHEIDALKEAIKELKSGMSSDVDVTSFIDHTEIKAKLSKALQEKQSFESKFETEYRERTRLAEELKTTQETLNTTNLSASEAMTRLEVLGKYFQERESELLKELSTKESLWLSKQGESASTVEKMDLLQQEIQRFKEKCDALTLELAEQESSRRSALSEVETRAHAAWLEARAAKRDADAARDEAAALRRKLAALSAADGAVSPHHKVVSPLDSAESPVLPPPLPPMFLPPPLLPPLPRPPPLGRLPSPHPPRYGDRRYSPDSRYSPSSRYSPDSRYSPETVRYSPDSRYSPRSRRSPYSPRSRRRSRSRERYDDSRSMRSRNGPAPPPADTETEYNSDSPSRQPRRRGRYSRHSGPSSGSGCSSESDK